MTSVGRIMSPEAAFATLLREAQGSGTHARGTISVTEAQKALTQLEGHPHADAAERARIVQGFLDGKEGQALSPKAREALGNFVKAQGEAAPGQKSTQLKADALQDARGAEFQLDLARGHVAALLSKGMVGKGELTKVTTALDKALTSVADARKSLTGLLKVADHAAKTADDELKAAGGELQKAQRDVATLVARAKGGAVTKAQLSEVAQWLDAPKAELQQAQTQLDPQPRISTRKFPSDNEDGGFNGGGPGGATSLKFPSDNEDGGPRDGGNVGPGVGGGGMMHSMKAPSDNEDGGGVVIEDKPTVQPQSVSQKRLDEMKKVFERLDRAGTLQWHSSMPLGARVETVALSKENHADGFQYDAMIPVGALSPTAQKADPNTVDTFWVRRTGGIAGLTQFAGPFSIGNTKG